MEQPDAIERVSRLRKKELRAILHISNMVGSVMPFDEILKIIVDTTVQALNVQCCSIYLFEADRSVLTLAATHGLNPDLVGKVNLRPGQGIPGWVAEHGQMVSLRNAFDDPRFTPIAGSEEEAYKAYLCAPLYMQTRVVGVMSARKAGEYEFTDAEKTLFEAICKQVAIVFEKKRLYNDKIEVERLAAIGLSLSEISHYIKNVLQAMKGGTYFVDSGLSRDDLGRVRQGWETLRRSHAKIASLVGNMLSFSRTSNPRLEDISLQELVFEILESITPTARRRGVIVEPDIEEGLPEVRADYESLHNAVLNLITNAMDAMEGKGGGIVRVGAKRVRDSNVILLSVADTGCGIPPDKMGQIFKLFYSTKGARGTGIGLAVTKKIVEELGGSISVESVPDEGTTFTLSIPVGHPSVGE
jgi:two-component system, NtrC family, sensor kinase